MPDSSTTDARAVVEPFDRILLPDRWRRAMPVVIAFCVLGVAALGWWYAGARTAGQLDASIGDPLIAGGQNYEEPLWLLTAPGSPPGLLLGMVILVFAARRTGRRPVVVLAIAGPVLAALIVEFVLKPIIDRTHYGSLALPSGHANSIAAQITVFMIGFVAVGLPRRTWVRRLLVLLAGCVVVGVCGAMVSLERHYATDTAAGILVGIAVVGAVALGLDAWTRRSLFRSAEYGLPGHAGGG
ncbi:phosphatase PAP2 family protein [Pseudonocardia spinosispora]|uniref:phosphatase PAP2 family protein n=1 Tax=Pseudonocardia spinosispora TaxID=103441 RepID=UPI0012EC6011|nr:phosphatase PAP2 family protein [Pseudonocardia spinosispora]